MILVWMVYCTICSKTSKWFWRDQFNWLMVLSCTPSTGSVRNQSYWYKNSTSRNLVCMEQRRVKRAWPYDWAKSPCFKPGGPFLILSVKFIWWIKYTILSPRRPPIKSTSIQHLSWSPLLARESIQWDWIWQSIKQLDYMFTNNLILTF